MILKKKWYRVISNINYASCILFFGDQTSNQTFFGYWVVFFFLGKTHGFYFKKLWLLTLRVGLDLGADVRVIISIQGPHKGSTDREIKRVREQCEADKGALTMGRAVIQPAPAIQCQPVCGMGLESGRRRKHPDFLDLNHKHNNIQAVNNERKGKRPVAGL